MKSSVDGLCCRRETRAYKIAHRTGQNPAISQDSRRDNYEASYQESSKTRETKMAVTNRSADGREAGVEAFEDLKKSSQVLPY